MKSEKLPAQIHFIGIGGAGMAPLAQYCLKTGRIVSGYDQTPSQNTKLLQSLGAEIRFGGDVSVPPGAMLAVYTQAIPLEHPALEECRRRGIPVLERAELLGEVTRPFDTYAVAGMHGKTTVSCMLAEILTRAGKNPTCFLGAGSDKVPAFRFGGETCVAEACEYRRSFLHLHPLHEVLLNAEEEHLDYYRDLADVQQAFRSFVRNRKPGGVLVYGQGENLDFCGRAPNGISFGLREGDYHAGNLCFREGRARFDVVAFGKKAAEVSMRLTGEHNVKNALAAFSAAHATGVNAELCAEALSAFTGAERRQTRLSCAFTSLYCDYAHHPTEISATLAALRLLPHRRLIAVFQPHTYSRTQKLLKKFLHCFDAADEVWLLPTFAAREQPECGADEKVLFCALKHSNKGLFSGMEEAFSVLPTRAGEQDLLVLLGAGDVNLLAERLSRDVPEGARD